MVKMGHFKNIEHKKVGHLKKHVINLITEKEPKMKFFDFGAFQNKMQMPLPDKIIFHMLFEAFYISSRMHSVKPLKSKNRDKIYLDAPNSNLKKRL